jgi:Zn-dependent protease
VNDSVQLGRLAGIRIGAHWSLLVIFVLLTWSLAAGQLPAAAGRQPVAAYWTAAVVASLLFFGSLLGHEMAHALVARRLGIEIEGITLWLFGGVARLRAEAGGPGAELRIAAAGPAFSAAVVVLFLAVAAGLRALGAPALAVAAASWLGVINALLAAFNLLPAFPLDGGRVLRAVLWMRGRDLRRATVLAARTGAVLSYAMIGVGIVFFFAGDVFNGVWFAFLGWFLLSAARAEEEGTVIRHSLAGLRVADAMTPDPFVAPGWITVDALIHDYVLKHRHSTYPVRDFDGLPQGLVTLDRLRRVPPDGRRTTRVADVAHPLAEVVTASPSEPLADLVQRLPESAGGRALVFDRDGRLVGIVSPADVARALAVGELAASPSR